MKHLIRVALSLVLASLIVVVIWVNWNHASASDVTTESIIKQLRYLDRELTKGADVKMQHLYPEGYVFMNSLYALAWCDLLQQSEDVVIHKEGGREIDEALRKIQSEEAKAIFDVDLLIPYGAFYSGWSTYVLGRKLEVFGRNDEQEIKICKTSCDTIASALQRQVFPESYRNDAWPADAVVCAAALALHDRTFVSKYSSILRDWVNRVNTSLDSRRLIPHAAMTGGKTAEGARGASQSLMLSFLPEIDHDFSREQFEIFETHFVDSRFGLPGIREYPKDVYGVGDIDSGPLILGMGGAASIVGIRVLALYDHGKCMDLRNGVEAFAFPLETETEKKYLFGQLPMADAFLTWSQASLLTKAPDRFAAPWKFRIYSGLLCMILGGTIIWMWRPRN